MKTYTCPDCGKTFESDTLPTACPDCGCPFDMFKQHIEEKALTMYTCPDCGKTFEGDTLPHACPDCGCPSDMFKQHIHIEKKRLKNTSTQNKTMFLVITLFIISVLGGFGYLAYNKAQEVAEQAIQEQYALEKAAEQERVQRKNEERKREESVRQQKRSDMINKLLGTWKTATFTTRTGIYDFRMIFKSSGQIEINMYDYVGSSFGRLHDTDYGSWEMIGPTENDNSTYLVIRWNGNTEKNRFTGSSVSFGGRSYSKGNFGGF